MPTAHSRFDAGVDAGCSPSGARRIPILWPMFDELTHRLSAQDEVLTVLSSFRRDPGRSILI